MTLYRGIGYLVLVLAVQGGAKPPEHVLDLVAVALQPAGASSATDELQIPGGALATEDSNVNLRVSLDSVAPTRLAGGDTVFYEITIENRGPRPVALPWSPTNEGLTRKMDGASVALLSLAAAATSAEPGDLPVVTQVLYGAKPAPDSVISLRRGERARIRTAGEWTLQSLVLQRVTPERTLSLVGTITLYLRDGTVRARSSNEVQVAVEP